MALVRHKALRSTTWWVGAALLVLSILTYLVSREYGRAGTMPGLASLAIGGLALVHTVVGLMFGVIADDREWHDDAERVDYARRRRRYLVVAAVVITGIWLVGFHITLPLFLFLFVGLNLRQWVVAGLLAALIWVFTYIVLANTLHILFPTSVLQRFMIANGWF